MDDEIRKPNTTSEVLEAALKKEKAAYRFYDRLLKENMSIDILKETIEKLRDEEYKHIRFIEKKIAKLGLG